MKLRSAIAVERTGECWFTTLAGGSIDEVSKRLYAQACAAVAATPAPRLGARGHATGDARLTR
jgi:hypothetical protein